MSRHQCIVVVSSLNLRHSSEIYRGVADYASDNRLDWPILPLGHDFETKATELHRAGAVRGIIGTFVSDRWLGDLPGIHTVNLFGLSRIWSVPTVGIDDRALGAAAAAHLVEQGAMTFAFAGRQRRFEHAERCGGFTEALPTSTAGTFAQIETGPLLRHEAIDLPSGSGPVGIFCATDRDARALVKRLRQSGTGQIGEDYLIVGVDNEPIESVFAEIALSSFSLPIYECGRRAADLLAASMGGRSPDPCLHAVEGWALQPRESSLREAAPHLAARVAATLEAHIDDETVSIERIARSLGHSRRRLELAFRAGCGQSPYQWLLRRRIDRAKNLLATTRLKIQEVGLRCGYSRQQQFSATFRRQVGLSPSHFRSLRNEAAGK